MQPAVLFKIFSLPVTSYGIMCACAAAVLLLLCTAGCRFRGVSSERVLVFGVISIPCMLVLSRVVYVLAGVMYYFVTLGSPIPPLRFWEGGYSMMGALIACLLCAKLTDKIFKSSPKDFSFTDIAALALPFAIAVERIGEVSTGIGLGKVMVTGVMSFISVPDEVGTAVHPVYLYEFAVSLLIGVVMVIWAAKRRDRLNRYDLMYTFLTLFGSFQIVLESLRNDNHMVVHFVRIQQIIALLMVLFAALMWLRQLKAAVQIKKRRYIYLALVYVICILICVKQEFAVDSSENPWMDYGIMALASGIMGYTTLLVGSHARKAQRGGLRNNEF